jgi:hypothetical protein
MTPRAEEFCSNHNHYVEVIAHAPNTECKLGSLHWHVQYVRVSRSEDHVRIASSSSSTEARSEIGEESQASTSLSTLAAITTASQRC